MRRLNWFIVVATFAASSCNGPNSCTRTFAFWNYLDQTVMR
jgi:hypothetical protein